MIVAGPALPHQSAIRIPQINANQSYIPDWNFLAGRLVALVHQSAVPAVLLAAVSAPLPRSCLLCRAGPCSALFFRVWLVQSSVPH